MLAVVLAATLGTSSAEVDPAARVGGLSLLARTVFTLQRAGAERILVVGGAAVGEQVAELARDARVEAELDHLALDGGEPWASLQGRIDEPFMLASWDRVVEPGIFEQLREAVLGDRLAVVASRGPRQLGPALLRPQALAQVAGFESLVKREDILLLEVDGWVLAADTAEARRQAEKRLFDACRKPQDGLVSRHLNRHLSIALSRLLVNTPVTPNQMTVATFAVSLVACWLVYRGGYANSAAAGVLMQVNSILDGCDGELARVRWQGSKLGQWLDTVGDDASNVLFWAALGFGARAQPEWGEQLALAAWVTAVGNGLAALQYYVLLVRKGSGDIYALAVHQASDRDSWLGKVVEAVAMVLKQDFFLFLVMCFALAGVLYQAAPLFALGALTTLIAATARTIRSALQPPDR